MRCMAPSQSRAEPGLARRGGMAAPGAAAAVPHPRSISTTDIHPWGKQTIPCSCSSSHFVKKARARCQAPPPSKAQSSPGALACSARHHSQRGIAREHSVKSRWAVRMGSSIPSPCTPVGHARFSGDDMWSAAGEGGAGRGRACSQALPRTSPALASPPRPPEIRSSHRIGLVV